MRRTLRASCASRALRALRATLSGACFALAIMGVPSSVLAQNARVGAWATAPQAVAQHPAAPSFNRAPAAGGRTVRQIVYPTLSGNDVRVRFSNAYGTQPLMIERASLAISSRGAAINADSVRLLTFGGQPTAKIAPGASLESDPLPFAVRAGTPLAVSLFTRESQPPTTWHKIAQQTAFLSGTGDFVDTAQASVFPTRFTNTLWLAGLSVVPDTPAYAIVAIGDSITDGMRSTLNANRRWPDGLARRLESAGRRDVAVLNLGISGNRLLHDSACYGERLVARFRRDALEQPGVRTVIVQIGINDINFGYVPPHGGLDCDVPHVIVTAPEMIAGYQALIAAARARNVRILGTTIPPGKLPPEREAVREAVNQWVRTGGAFDGVIDFDAALRDPAQPTRMLPRLDSGDGTHPSDAGYAAMADAVSLPLVLGGVR
ncbi:SGNH/GDSL hydrolase family protein [Pandoraea apista]|uniref:SGNH/GDSL hydrolase family protein n=1 Tax=Pandoraea apista TaxID=93218 RepID=A0ABX9ZPD6_9BURK|nr:SGNH/GDSL hydrolase family protein [Pandoraea apista]PTD98786.1 GDSL family lipase [Pandoraea apista]RRJ34840.1 SGNH/GDSL hydrolase family protein [Pandoraea apista]RRJ80858.1 SGNH/GDSL hydrolase family protein [Pandoraea apista]RSD16860.1 SGNH/GDSL hydrolase family protein [Pandoraea apista]RSD21024.1 SGNH/GDSL hydrolase family protein [Pandoraea apista]